MNFLVNQLEWVTSIEIDEQRKAEIQPCFNNKDEFHLATEPNNLVSLIENFKYRTRDIINNESDSVFGEKMLWMTSQILLTIAKNVHRF